MQKKAVIVSEAAGAAAVSVFAVWLSKLYFYEQSALAVLFCKVNESAWESMKVFGFAYSFYGFLELLWLRPPFKRFVAVKVISLYALMSALLLFFFFSSGRLSGVFSAAAGAVFVISAFTLSGYLLIKEKEAEGVFPLAAMLFMLFFLMFFSFTIFPPKLDIFYDDISGILGVT